MTDTRPPSYQGQLPDYEPPPAYPPRSTGPVWIGSVSRWRGREQALLPRTPLQFDRSHGVFLQIQFTSLSLPTHALGVAYVNYANGQYVVARCDGLFHVILESSQLANTRSRMRLDLFAGEAIQRAGRAAGRTYWYYFRWHVPYYSPTGQIPFQGHSVF